MRHNDYPTTLLMEPAANDEPTRYRMTPAASTVILTSSRLRRLPSSNPDAMQQRKEQ